MSGRHIRHLSTEAPSLCEKADILTRHSVTECVPFSYRHLAVPDEQMLSLGETALGVIPKTAALVEQKVSSLTAEQGWWLDTLMRGELPWGIEELGVCPACRLFDRYIKAASRHGARRKVIETQLGIFLHKYVPGLIKCEGSYMLWNGSTMISASGTIYKFPALEDCRGAFAKRLQQNVTWGHKDVWSIEPVPDPTTLEPPF